MGRMGGAVGTPCRHFDPKATGLPNFDLWSVDIQGELGDSGWRDSVCFGPGCREQLESLRLFALKPDRVTMDPSLDVVSMFVDVSSIAAWCDMDEITTVSLLSNSDQICTRGCWLQYHMNRRPHEFPLDVGMMMLRFCRLSWARGDYWGMRLASCAVWPGVNPKSAPLQPVQKLKHGASKNWSGSQRQTRPSRKRRK